MSEKSEVFRLKRKETFTLIVFKLVIVLAFIFCIINFKQNPIAFSVFALLAFLLLGLITGKAELIVFEETIVLSGSYLFYLFKYKRVIPFENIKKVQYQGSKYNPMNLVYYVPGTNQKEGMKLIMKKDDFDNVLNYGTRNEMLEVCEYLHKKINQE